MSGAVRASIVALALVGIGLAAGVLHARESAYPLTPVSERLLYLRSGKTADRLMLSFDAIAADVYWIRSIQHYGRDLKNKTPDGRFELVAPLLDLTTTLDPQFMIAYRFGSIFLALQPPTGPGRADLAIKLLEKGLAANPSNYYLCYDLGFVHYFHTGDFLAAAEWFERAAAMPGAPSWYGPLAATTKAQGGNRDGARQLLRVQLQSEERYIRSAAERTLEQLDALDAIDHWQTLVERFNTAQGRYPASWLEMIQHHVISTIPVDPRGVPYGYDAVTRRVVLSPQSSLSPLPEIVRAR